MSNEGFGDVAMDWKESSDQVETDDLISKLRNTRSSVCVHVFDGFN